MTVVDKHTCSSPVVIKLEAIYVAVDVVVDKFDFFVIFLCWDVYNKLLGIGYKLSSYCPLCSMEWC